LASLFLALSKNGLIFPKKKKEGGDLRPDHPEKKSSGV
jgi:hypothetical protein